MKSNFQTGKAVRKLLTLTQDNKRFVDVALIGANLVLNDIDGSPIFVAALEPYLQGRVVSRLVDFVGAGFRKFVGDTLVDASTRRETPEDDYYGYHWTDGPFLIAATGRYIKRSGEHEFIPLFSLTYGNIELINEHKPAKFSQFPSVTEVRDCYRHWLSDTKQLLALISYLERENPLDTKIIYGCADGKIEIGSVTVGCKHGRFRYYAPLHESTYLDDLHEAKSIVKKFECFFRQQRQLNDPDVSSAPLETKLQLV